MTKLNKIAKVLVLSGMSCWVSIAQATEIEVNHSTGVDQQINISQQASSADNSTQASAQSNNAVESESQASVNSSQTNDEENEEEQSENQSLSGSTATNAQQNVVNDTQLVAVSNSLGKGSNIATSTATRLSQSLNQVSNVVLPSSTESITLTPAFNGTAKSATSLASTIQGGNIELPDTQENAESPTTADDLPSDELSAKNSPVTQSDLDNAIAGTINTTTLITSATEVTQQVSSNVETIVTADAAAQAVQNIEQNVSANVADTISSNAQAAISENVNGAIASSVAEQVNTELAAATTAEVVNTLASDLDIGL